MPSSTTGIVVAVTGGTHGVITAGQGISVLLASGQLIAGIVSAIAPIGAIAVNPAAGLVTLIKLRNRF
jgi:hypothetical protein